jgi:hypothetical protein
MAIAALHRNIENESVRAGGPSLPRRILAFLIILGEVWGEMQEMRREAQRRYPHLEL